MPTPPRRRIEGIDVARGLAAMMMIFGHAFDAWVTPAGKATWAYDVKRFTGAFPLPTFLLLAGVAVAWGVGSATRRGEPASTVRARVVRRGLEIVAVGYAANVGYAALDGTLDPRAILHADVLQVIGLAIAGFAWLGIRPARRAPRGPSAAMAGGAAAPDPGRFSATAVTLGIAAVLVCPWATRAAAGVDGPLAALLAPLVEVPGGWGSMPLVPLAGWFAAGAPLGQAMLAARRGLEEVPRAGAPTGFFLRLAVVGAALALAGLGATAAWRAAWPGTFDRAHLVIWANAVDLGGRALVFVALAALLSNHLRGVPRWVLLTFGRHSLAAYVFHLPFTYGALGRPIRGRLDVPEAMLGVVALWALSLGAVLAWSRRRQGTAPRTPVGPASPVTRRRAP